MTIRFRKMNGAGNDFVVIDNRAGLLRPSAEIVRRLCDRKRGIGADGIILLENDEATDFRMSYFNSDGGEAAMCGNGARCAAVFARDLGLGIFAGGDVRLRFATGAGTIEAVVRGDRATLSMTDATGYEESVVIQTPVGREIVHVVRTGVPHAVVVESHWDRLNDEAVVRRGRSIRFHERFAPEGVNVNFVGLLEGGPVAIRTYERGVEGETLACGTGAVAAAVVLAHLGLATSPVELATLGGERLKVWFSPTPGGAESVLLEGPVAVNFDGAVDL